MEAPSGQLLQSLEYRDSDQPPCWRRRANSCLARSARCWVMAKTGMKKPFSLHGLRKAGVCRLIIMGLSVHQIMAITGHRTPKEIDRYGRDYMRSVASEQGYQRYLAWTAQNEAIMRQMPKFSNRGQKSREASLA